MPHPSLDSVRPPTWSDPVVAGTADLVAPRQSSARKVLRYGWGMLAHPRATIDALALEQTVRFAIIIALLGVAQAWINNAVFAAVGFDYLGSAPLLTNPTYVGGMGYLRIAPEQFRLLFPGFILVTAVYGLLVPAATAQLLSKVWHGRGAFEQMLNVLAFAATPTLVIGWLSEWLTGVPLNLLTGSAYFYTDAMQGRFGPTLATFWTVYSMAVYIVPWTWSFVLSVIAIHRVQRIPYSAAAFIHLIGFSLNMLLVSTFIR